jgi:hypothetical protein
MTNYTKYQFKLDPNKKLQTGDLLVYYSFNTNDFENLLNNFDWTHISIINVETIDNHKVTFVYELDPCKYGIIKTPINEHLKSYCGSVLLLRPKYLNKTQQRQITSLLHNLTLKLHTNNSPRSLVNILYTSVQTLFSHETFAWCISLIIFIYTQINYLNFDSINNNFLITPQDFITNPHITQLFYQPTWLKQHNLADSCSITDNFGLCVN